MKLKDVVEKLSLEVRSADSNLQKDVSGVYVSDLLSDVMANGREGNIWVTLQTHLNIVAVAGLKNMAGIIIVGNRQIQDDVLHKARAEDVTIMSTSMQAFEVAGKLYQLLH